MVDSLEKDGLKKHGINVSLSTVTTLAALVPILWFIGKPILVEQISGAMASELEDIVEEEQEPIENAFKAILLSDINKLRKDIARLRVHERDDEWTEEDAVRLADMEIDLKALQDAYDALD